MIRLSARFTGALALAALSLSVFQAAAQQQVPNAPAPGASVAPLSAPAPAMAPVFPKTNPANFNATGPSVEAFNNFMHIYYGWQDGIVWQVQAILKTPIDGLSLVAVSVADKTTAVEPQSKLFYAAVDGKHVIRGEEIVRSDEHPFAQARALLQQRADGPYRGAASKDLELVEFADFQCPVCKAVQANMDQLAVDFPKARFVFQTLPLAELHPQATRAAAYGVCVAKLGGSDAFFTYASAAFDGQEGLASADGATLTLNSAVAKAGLDPAKIATCATDPATVATVAASVKLAQDLGFYGTPTLFVNGRKVPANVPYNILKQVVLYQAKLDGVAAQ